MYKAWAGEVVFIEEESAQARHLSRKGEEVLTGAVGTWCCDPVWRIKLNLGTWSCIFCKIKHMLQAF